MLVLVCKMVRRVQEYARDFLTYQANNANNNNTFDYIAQLNAYHGFVNSGKYDQDAETNNYNFLEAKNLPDSFKALLTAQWTLNSTLNNPDGTDSYMLAYEQADLKVKKAMLGQLTRLGNILIAAVSYSPISLLNI